jgi:hypothetical protein
MLFTVSDFFQNNFKILKVTYFCVIFTIESDIFHDLFGTFFSFSAQLDCLPKSII